MIKKITVESEIIVCDLCEKEINKNYELTMSEGEKCFHNNCYLFYLYPTREAFLKSLN